MNIYLNQTVITLLLLVFVNVSGYLYSLLYVKNLIGKSSRIQAQSRTDLNYLNDHLPLIIFNVLTLMLFVFIGFYFFKDSIINQESISILGILLQLFVILLFDDTFFYFLHRLMHENKYIYTKIHKIHHRANSPIAIDYIYVHPLEWMSGFIGPFIGILIMGGVNIYTFWLYLFVRNFHELAIHSGLKSSFISRIIPFYGNNEHHDLHHAKRDGNYASTFNFWDILFKTRL
tara:strand:- start:383 stop:1075 length:693 start_codon:yes stop_codon:yes gene_type:complete